MGRHRRVAVELKQTTLGEHRGPRKTRQDSSSLGSAARRLTLSRYVARLKPRCGSLALSEMWHVLTALKVCDMVRFERNPQQKLQGGGQLCPLCALPLPLTLSLTTHCESRRRETAGAAALSLSPRGASAAEGGVDARVVVLRPDRGVRRGDQAVDVVDAEVLEHLRRIPKAVKGSRLAQKGSAGATHAGTRARTRAKGRVLWDSVAPRKTNARRGRRGGAAR